MTTASGTSAAKPTHSRKHAKLSLKLSGNMRQPEQAAVLICRAMGDPLRARILRVLSQNAFGVCELCQIFNMRQPALSHHLKVLAEAGLVEARREANSVFYRRAHHGRRHLKNLQQAFLDALDCTPEPAALKERINIVQRTREQASRRFFRDNAARFRQQQELIAPYEHYGEMMRSFVDHCTTPARRRRVLEVGPGDGRFLPVLATRFREIWALDNSATMLAQARKTALAAGVDNIRFVHGDTEDPQLREVQADCIVMNMVLHHVAAPAQLICDTGKMLTPEGTLLICDLCRHNQEWVRNACGDLWLGFTPEELDRWAKSAGLRSYSSLYLAQRNGFCFQLHSFRLSRSPGQSSP